MEGLDFQRVESSRPAPQSAYHVETVLSVRHWTNRYFSFSITRPQSFRFRSGEFVMIGLPAENKAVMRAYSIASPSFADELEFFSIAVPDGLLTSGLQNIQIDDHILLGRKPTGTLVLDALKPGKRLWLIGTGTGLAPWLSVTRDSEAYERHTQIIVTHTVREATDLAYRDFFERDIHDDALVGTMARESLVYYPTVTRGAFHNEGRITERIRSGVIFRDLGLSHSGFNPAEDRVMVCGSIAMIKDVIALLEAQGMIEGSNGRPGDFVVERAFAG